MRSSGSRVDLAEKPSKSGQILDQHWKLFFGNFYEINSSQDFFLYCKKFGVDGTGMFGKELPALGVTEIVAGQAFLHIGQEVVLSRTSTEIARCHKRTATRPLVNQSLTL